MTGEQITSRNRIIISQVRNAVSRNAENTSFNLEINHPDFGWIPYSLNPWDTDQTVNNNDLLALIGSNFENYVPPTQEELDLKAAKMVRDERSRLLRSEVDPVVSNSLRWADMATDKQNAWAQYRTDLLNVPQQSGFPHNITWPDIP